MWPRFQQGRKRNDQAGRGIHRHLDHWARRRWREPPTRCRSRGCQARGGVDDPAPGAHGQGRC
eukprot:5536948-Alexandrium_andersonii.AAC.1